MYFFLYKCDGWSGFLYNFHYEFAILGWMFVGVNLMIVGVN
jgi:hypothetical protein